MRAWGRRLAYGLIALAAVLGGLYVAIPPAKTEQPWRAPPDPILWARKPVVKALHHVGVPRPWGPARLDPQRGIHGDLGGARPRGSTFETARSAQPD